jgi:hypothetical protein
MLVSTEDVTMGEEQDLREQHRVVRAWSIAALSTTGDRYFAARDKLSEFDPELVDNVLTRMAQGGGRMGVVADCIRRLLEHREQVREARSEYAGILLSIENVALTNPQPHVRPQPDRRLLDMPILDRDVHSPVRGSHFDFLWPPHPKTQVPNKPTAGADPLGLVVGSSPAIEPVLEEILLKGPHTLPASLAPNTDTEVTRRTEQLEWLAWGMAVKILATVGNPLGLEVARDELELRKAASVELLAAAQALGASGQKRFAPILLGAALRFQDSGRWLPVACLDGAMRCDPQYARDQFDLLDQVSAADQGLRSLIGPDILTDFRRLLDSSDRAGK